MEKETDDEKGVFFFENQSFSLQDIYRILGFSTTPTDRELEAKIIMFIRKYNGHYSGNDEVLSGDVQRLYRFFDKLYDHFFVEDEVEESETGGSLPIETNDVFKNVQNSKTGVVEGYVSAPPSSTSSSTAAVATTDVSGGGVQTVNQVPYSKDVLNPILKQTIQRVISIDSRYRNINNTSNATNRLATNFTIELSEPLRDVLSLKLYSYQIPFTWYTVNKDYGSNFFIIKGNVPGLTDEYRVEIVPGNYSATTLTTAINDAIKTIASEYTDVSFGNTRLSYNTNTTVANFTVDIKKTFQEQQFYLDWVNWASPWKNIDRDTSGGNILNIPQYLGFDYSAYNLNSVYSSRDILPIKSVSQTDDERASIYYIRRGADVSNNYFTVVLYTPVLQQVGSLWSVNSFADVSNNSAAIIKTVHVILDLPEGGYPRKQLFLEIQKQIRACPYFLEAADLATFFDRFDQTDGVHSFFQLSIVFDRKKIPLVDSSKIAVIFPDESAPFGGGYYPIWTGDNSCFHFGQSLFEMNDIVAEYPLFPANYVIQGYPYVEFRVNIPGYEQNVIQAIVNKSSSTGYSYNEYITEINGAFSSGRIKINGVFDTSNNFGTLTFVNRTPFFFNSLSLPCFTFDFNYSLNTNDYYSVQYYNSLFVGSTAFLLQHTGGGIDTIDISGSGFNELVYSSGFSFELQSGIPISSSYNFKIPKNSIFLKIFPNQTQFAPIFEIPFVADPDIQYNEAGGYYQFFSFDAFVSDLLKSITNYNFSDNTTFPLKYSSVSKSVAVNGSGISVYQIQFNIVVNKIITQQDCTLVFYDVDPSVVDASNNPIRYFTDDTGNYSTGAKAPHSSWGSYLNFTDTSYNLGSASYNSSGSTTIVGTKSIQGSTFVVLSDTNRHFYFRPQNYANGLITGVAGDYIHSNYNDVHISVNAGNYSVNSLFDALNVAFSANEITRGTFISSVFKNGKYYCVLRNNINRQFYSKDYALDFYDLTSYVKCYVGSSVRNTTWDSTIGWILGFHEKTVYELSSYYTGTTAPIEISGELAVNTNLYSYFLISVDDFNQNRLNDGLVTITRPEQQVSIPSYSAIADITTDFSGNIGTSGSNAVAENNLTAKQVYAINQVLESRKNINKIYSQGPFVKDIFGYIPLKLPSTPGDLITEYGGTLQNQDRLYFGPVNIRRLQVQLINDKGTVMDLNGADWSFSFICEQLYQKKIT